MYAIVDIAGQQLKVEKNQKVYVNRLDAEEGSKVDFDKILLIDNEGKVSVGEPIVKDMLVSATIISHLKGDKIKVFKKKRRKGYKVLNGHRQQLTEILINDITAGKATNKSTTKKTEKPVEKKAETKAETKASAKSTEKKAEKPVAEKKTVKATTKSTTAKKETKTTTTKSKPAAKKDDKSTTTKAKPATKKPAAKKPAAKKTDSNKENKEKK
jgi:large subunit ribosomal protein L21